MAWFKRIKEGILTKTVEKKEAPDGVWTQCPGCKKTIQTKDYEEAFSVCPECSHHGRIGSNEYFRLLFNDGQYKEMFKELMAKDILKFQDLKSYSDRLEKSREKTGLQDAMRVGVGDIGAHKTVVAAMDFSFIGGSMGSVVGEKISLAIDHCIMKQLPFIIISKSGGARMMEAAFSLMQMAKTSAKLSLLAEAQLPYISILTDPTTGGVTASFAMLGDINIAEPEALIGFAGPRVIKETIKKDLPKGFQRSEFVQEKGFLDMIVARNELKSEVSRLLGFMKLAS